jgi:Cupredoxin-like domain
MRPQLVRSCLTAVPGRLVCAFLLGQPAYADEPAAIPVTLKDHRFMPAEIHIPVGKPSMLIVTNLDTTPEEFDSSALKVEKVIVGGTHVTIRLRPLGPGRYPFMGEYHPDSATGAVVAP